MKLSSTLFAAANAAASVNVDTCYAKDVDIDGNYFRTNVVEDIKPVYTAPDCQKHCQQWANRGCEFFVWEEQKSSCTLYKDIKEIESDVDEGRVCKLFENSVGARSAGC